MSCNISCCGQNAYLFTANLAGRNEVPKNNSGSYGVLRAYLSRDRKTLRFDLRSFRVPNIISAHFHLGYPGTNGAILKTINMNVCNGTATGFWSKCDSEQPLTDKNINDLMKGAIYVNVHSKRYPNGEIRGQVRWSG